MWTVIKKLLLLFVICNAINLIGCIPFLINSRKEDSTDYLCYMLIGMTASAIYAAYKLVGIIKQHL